MDGRQLQITKKLDEHQDFWTHPILMKLIMWVNHNGLPNTWSGKFVLALFPKGLFLLALSAGCFIRRKGVFDANRGGRVFKDPDPCLYNARQTCNKYFQNSYSQLMQTTLHDKNCGGPAHQRTGPPASFLCQVLIIQMAPSGRQCDADRAWCCPFCA